MHLLGRVGQQLTDLDAGHAGGDGTERSAGIGARLGIPAFQLAETPRHEENEHAFLLRGQLTRHRGSDQVAQPGDVP